MKKIILSVLVVSLAFALKAQEIPERKTEKPMMMHGQHKGHHGMDGIDMQKLNLTDAQKEQFKTQRESFRKQMEELKKNDNITVKEWKSRMETLKKDQRTKMQSILTSDQKAQLEKMKALRENDKMDMEKKKEKMKELMEKQKEQLKSILTEEQMKKLQEGRKHGPDGMHDRKTGKKEVI